MNKKARTVNNRNQRDRTNEVLFVDLRSWNKNIEEIVIDKGQKKRKIVLTDNQIAEIKKVFNNWQDVDTSLYSDVPEFCKSVKLDGDDGIRANNYSLAPSKYIEFIDHDLDIDFDKEMYRIQNEMQDIVRKEKESQVMLLDAFRGIGYEIN